MQYKLLLKNVKQITLRITPEAELVVTAPKNCSTGVIEKIIREKGNWINEKLSAAKKRLEAKKFFNLEIGGHIFLFGHSLPIVEGSKFKVENNFVFVPKNWGHAEIKSAMVKFYKKIAKETFTKRAFEIAEITGKKPECVKINSAKTRWGSCSGKGNINLSFFLAMADKSEVDYVILHELCHLHEMNHSKKFWNLVEKHMPDYKERKSRLKALEIRLREENW